MEIKQQFDFFELISLFKTLILKNEGSKPPSRSHNESY